MEKVNIKLVHKDAKVPVYATDGSGCFDIYSVSDGTVGMDGCEFHTGLVFEIPKGYALFIFSRSGHGFNLDIRLANCVGVIDSDYRGEVKVKLTSDGWATKFPVGDRIAQGCILPVPRIEFNVVDEVSETDRGQGGFGSTG